MDSDGSQKYFSENLFELYFCHSILQYNGKLSLFVAISYRYSCFYHQNKSCFKTSTKSRFIGLIHKYHNQLNICILQIHWKYFKLAESSRLRPVVFWKKFYINMTINIIYILSNVVKNCSKYKKIAIFSRFFKIFSRYFCL